MTKIKSFDRTNLKEVRQEVKKALADVEAKFGVSLSMGSIRYSRDEFRCKMTCRILPTKTVTSPIVDTTSSLTITGNFNVGSKFKRKTTVYEITGYNVGSKYCFSVINERGKRYKVTRDFINQGTFLKGSSDLSAKIKSELGV